MNEIETTEKTNPKSKGKLFTLKMYPTMPIILWVIITAGTMFLFPHQGAFRYNEYTKGSISQDEIIAPFTFEVLKSDEVLASEREDAARAVDPVFVRSDSVMLSQLDMLRGALAAVEAARDTLRPLARVRSAELVEKRRQLLADVREKYNVKLNDDSWYYLLGDIRYRNRKNPNYLTYELLSSILRDVNGLGVLDRPWNEIETARDQIRVIKEGEEQVIQANDLYDMEEALNVALERLNEQLIDVIEEGDESVTKVGYELLSSYIVANVFYDEEETRRRKDTAIAKVPLSDDIILKDERVIDSNERITDRHLKILRSMEIKRAEMASEIGGINRFMPLAGRLIASGLIYFFFGFWLRKFRPDIYAYPNRLLLFWTMLAVMVAAYGLIFQRYEINPYLFPSALGAVILTIVFDARVSFLYALILAIIGGLLSGNDLFAMFSIFIPAALSVFAVLRVRTRVQIMRSSFLILLGLVLVIVARRALTYQLIEMSVFFDLMYSTINALATPLLALGLLIIIELAFKVTSDLTLLELADLNRPLLKKLSLEAPGTYHHSIMVGNLAEAAAEAINANPLLVRAGAYYHDIGKMISREYFVENQLSQANIHDNLEPEESAKMLAEHVLQGVVIADKYHLPDSIKDFILEHHGTSLMVFFYNKALEIRPEGKVNEREFRYPGPKPQTKETGILMLADSAEAATRSLDEPDPDSILKAVRGVIINKYSDGEMDECPLTLHDLRLIMEAFVPILRGIHHHRIQYPSREELESKRDKALLNAAVEKEGD